MLLNNSSNIAQPGGVSAWFRKNYTGNYRELGDIVLEGITFAPEFLDFRSYRGGSAASRKRILSSRVANATIRCNEPSILNLALVAYGSSPAAAAGDPGVYESAQMEVKTNGVIKYVDFADITPAGVDYTDYTIIEIYADQDVLRADPISHRNTTVYGSNGWVELTETGLITGEIVYVVYQIAQGTLYESEVFGADDSVVEGALKIQALNANGGVLQIWDLVSVQLAPNGDLAYPLDDFQTVPLRAEIFERNSTFGKVYTNG